MNLAQYRLISKALYADLEKVVEAHGLKMGRISAGVEPLAGTVRLTLNLADMNLRSEDGEPTTPEQERFKQMAVYVGLREEHLGATFSSGGHTYTVSGMREGRSAKCITLLREDGKTFVMTAEDTRMRLGLPRQIGGAQDFKLVPKAEGGA